jgi:tRNA(fMet)-specific endonuclease VapC
VIVLLDTNILSDMVRNPGGRAARRLAAIGEATVATSVIVAGELRFGCIRKGSARLTERVEAVLREIETLAVDAAAAPFYSAIRADLEARGLPIGQNDLWIAAQAMALGAVLVTGNEGEFRRVAGLAVENWLAA